MLGDDGRKMGLSFCFGIVTRLAVFVSVDVFVSIDVSVCFGIECDPTFSFWF